MDSGQAEHSCDGNFKASLRHHSDIVLRPLPLRYLVCALLQGTISQQTLSFLEGTGSSNSINWGDNFGIAGASGFLSEVVTKPYIKNVVISPHVYPP